MGKARKDLIDEGEPEKPLQRRRPYCSGETGSTSVLSPSIETPTTWHHSDSRRGTKSSTPIALRQDGLITKRTTLIPSYRKTSSPSTILPWSATTREIRRLRKRATKLDSQWNAASRKRRIRKPSSNSTDQRDTEQDAPAIITDEEDREAETATAELLKLHYCFGHTPFSKLQVMARRGILAKRCAKCNIPVCSACQYAKATKRAWRPRTAKNYKPVRAVKPGDVVSVDQLVSPTPGLIAQISGFITKQRYKYATVYVDQATGLGFVYLQKEASVEETLESKAAWERYSRSRGVVVKAYHADNGIFQSKRMGASMPSEGSSFDFCGSWSTPYQWKSERRIRELQEMARTMLIHANRRWPEAISANLWPYAVRYANDCINATPNMQDPMRRSPMQLFTQSNVDINKKHYIPFGCPVYVLDADLQAGKKIHKWKERARVGIYLGQSPIHNKSVALVLNRFTGHVSPQFHVKMDPGFYSLKQERLISFWQQKTYFTDALEQGEPATRNELEGKREPMFSNKEIALELQSQPTLRELPTLELQSQPTLRESPIMRKQTSTKRTNSNCNSPLLIPTNKGRRPQQSLMHKRKKWSPALMRAIRRDKLAQPQAGGDQRA